MLNYWRNNPCGDTHLTGLRSRHLYSSEGAVGYGSEPRPLAATLSFAREDATDSRTAIHTSGTSARYRKAYSSITYA